MSCKPPSKVFDVAPALDAPARPKLSPERRLALVMALADMFMADIIAYPAPMPTIKGKP
jgi:hypothetical protein